MNLYAIETGRFRLDGGAMFGVVPKVIWEKTNPADAQNRIDMAMRCLLIEDGGRLILVDNGLGDKYDEKFGRLYGVDHAHSNLDQSLSDAGFSRKDITDVVLTHLHFDHCGGSTSWNATKGRIETAFENANFWLQRSHLAMALQPNAREKASFYDDNIQPLMQSGQLQLLDGPTELFPGFTLKVVNGHTEAQQLPVIDYRGKKILFAADLFPSYGHLPLPYVMGYDTRPLLTLEERAELLPWIVGQGVIVFYEHDPYHECGTVKRNEKGGFSSDQTFKLSEV
jgi:glyoxylase-like metal-dependent hydrolase (beta-lactamase superfamily II)